MGDYEQNGPFNMKSLSGTVWFKLHLTFERIQNKYCVHLGNINIHFDIHLQKSGRVQVIKVWLWQPDLNVTEIHSLWRHCQSSQRFQTEHFQPVGQYCRWTHVTEANINATGCETLLLLLPPPFFHLVFSTLLFFFSLSETAINSRSVSPSGSTKAAHLCVC